jgi:hypothetical protein
VVSNTREVLTEFTDFSEHCVSESRCIRGKVKDKNCARDYKQKACFKKHIQSIEKKFQKLGEAVLKDEEWQKVREQIFQRDGSCRIWAILSEADRNYILERWRDQYVSECKILDCCHIISRAHSRELIYELGNIVLCSRFFHRRLDGYRHPVTNETISKEERILWFESAKLGKKFPTANKSTT